MNTAWTGGCSSQQGENSDVSCRSVVTGMMPVNVLRVAVIVTWSPAAGGVTVAVVPRTQPLAFVLTLTEPR
jgi:hypothetical protein